MQIEVEGKKIYYEMAGKGQTILFVHGWGGTSNSLKELAHLFIKNYQTIILDLPGFGKSDLPHSNWGIEEYVRILLSFLKKLGLKEIIYFGHSFGGSLGIYLCANEPKLIEKLILCASPFKRTHKFSQTVKNLRNLTENIPILKSVYPFLRHLVYRIFFPSSDLVKFPKLETNFRKIVTQDLTLELKNICASTLILWGEKDSYVPISSAHELNKQIKKSRLKIYPEIGHNLPIKYPGLIYKEVLSFLRRQESNKQ